MENRHWTSVLPADLPLGSPAFALYVMPPSAFTYDQYLANARAAGFVIAPSSARRALQPLVKLGLVELKKRIRAEPDTFVPGVPTCIIPAIASIIETHRREIRFDEKGYQALATAILGFLHCVDDDGGSAGSMGAEVEHRIQYLIARIDARFALTVDAVAHARMSAQTRRRSLLGESLPARKMHTLAKPTSLDRCPRLE